MVGVFKSSEIPIPTVNINKSQHLHAQWAITVNICTPPTDEDSIYLYP